MKSKRSQGTKFPQSAAAFIVRCCLKEIIRTCKRRNPHYRSFFLHILTRAADIVLHSLSCTPHASAAVSLCFLPIRRLRDTEGDRKFRKMLHKFQFAVLCIFQAGCKQYPMPLSARMTACEPTSRSRRRRRCAGLCRKERQTKKAEKPVMIATASASASSPRRQSKNHAKRLHPFLGWSLWLSCRFYPQAVDKTCVYLQSRKKQKQLARSLPSLR